MREEENNSHSDNEESKQDPQNSWYNHNYGSSINADEPMEESKSPKDDGKGEKDKVKENNRGRFKVFQLEVVFINRKIDQTVEYYNKVLMGFESHPTSKKASKFGSKAKATSNEDQSLQDCLEYFRKQTKLDKDNAWYCNVCKEHREATKKIELYSVPPILIFCFQRFKSHNIYFKDKLEDRINFPIQDLDMSPFIASEDQKQSGVSLLYDLYAVSNHYGSLAFGHYTAFCKNA